MNDTHTDRALVINLDQSVPCQACDHVATTRATLRCCNTVTTICHTCLDRARDRWERARRNRAWILECAQCGHEYESRPPFTAAVRTFDL